MHPAEDLWQHHSPLKYPSGVLAIQKPILGTSFFPGGFGLWNPTGIYPLPAFPVGDVMVLGHDFHSETGYRASLLRGSESLNQPTWRNLLKVLGRVGIAPERCFFTNVYMGLRAGSATTGIFPGSTDKAFVEHCQRFLEKQISTQRPSLIITLGVNAPRVLASLSDNLMRWRNGNGFHAMNNKDSVIANVQFADISEYSATVVALIHPSQRQASLRHRKYAGLSGDAAEIQLLKDAVEISRARATR